MFRYRPGGKLAFEPVLNRIRGRLGPRTLVYLFRRRLAVFFWVLVAVVFTCLIVSHEAPPLFRAETEVLLGGPSADAEIARLRSPAMASAVAARIHVADRAVLAAPDSLLRRLSSLLRISRPPGSPVAEAEIIDRLQENVSIAHTPETLSLTISYSATDAAVAARVANAYAATYTGSPARSDRNGVAGERIITTATRPVHSISLGLVSTVLLGFGLGSFLGLAAALTTELRFPGLTTGADVQSRLWVRHLGSVPSLASALPNGRSVLDAVVDHPQSGFAEAFRNVIRRVHNVGGKQVQVIAVASSVPGEGATTVAMAMARTLALGRQTVVLVDCDARCRISKMFGVDAASVGLADVLHHGANVDEALFDDAVSGAAVLPETRSAEYRFTPSPRKALLALFDYLRTRYDVVLLSVGPIAAETDVRWLRGITDTVLLVARWRSTPDTDVLSAIRRFQVNGVSVAGIALNLVNIKNQARYTDDEPSVYQEKFAKYFQ